MGSKQTTVMVVTTKRPAQSVCHCVEKALQCAYCCDSGRACIEQKLRGKKVDTLLLDYRLGNATGDDVASKIRDLDGTKTILISAYELERERVNELNACHCIVDLVHTPVSIKILMERVQQAFT